MPNTYTIYPFFKEGKTGPKHGLPPQTSGLDESSVFNNQIYADLTLEAKGDAACFPLEVYGCVDQEGEKVWTKLAMISMTDFSVADNAPQEGIYAVGVGGVVGVKVKLAAAGNVTVTGKFGG
jgi:hypothetical protein